MQQFLIHFDSFTLLNGLQGRKNVQWKNSFNTFSYKNININSFHFETKSSMRSSSGHDCANFEAPY